MKSFWQEFGEMPDKINRVNVIMRDVLYSSANRYVREVLDHQFSSEGKYLRAGLTILSAQAGGKKTEGLYETAAAIEMIHMATLVHDDIIDDSKLRRGKESIQSRFGKDIAVYTGDYILAKAFRIMSEQKFSHVNLVSRGIEKICMGEILQNQIRYQEASAKKYLRVIDGKTAILFQISARIGSEIGGMNCVSQMHLSNSARQIGLAFQIMDDCRDYDGALKDLRKESGSDVANGIYTLPLILAMESGKHPGLSEALKTGDTASVVAAICASDEIVQARAIAYRYYEKAMKHLSYLPDEPNRRMIEEAYKRLI